MATDPARYSPGDIASERYCERFGAFPPLFYMSHLSDAAFAERVNAAVDQGVEIDPEEFEQGVPEGALL